MRLINVIKKGHTLQQFEGTEAVQEGKPEQIGAFSDCEHNLHL